MASIPTNPPSLSSPHALRRRAAAPPNASRSPRAARPLLLLCAALTTANLAACQRPLFDARDPRSQYDRTDAARNTRPEQFVMDEYGNRRPNIRGRLIGNQ